MYSAPRASLLPMVSRSSVSSSRAPPPPWATAPRGCGCPAHVAAQDAPHGLLEARFCHICNKEEPTLPAAKLQAINFPVLLIDDFSTPEKNQSFSNEKCVCRLMRRRIRSTNGEKKHLGKASLAYQPHETR
ncbi:uncharacterized protein [Triticum aestivum]|uniref:uncharacterized protein isoform X1 n=1 Tax=Triticum aestivum TaxID=4565 RepID=UPI001ABC75B2|nr:uncharacterized protein LOC109775947 isoform X1 [Aegilops tauschii subsp. strangulata]XP_044374260.1 uncharacterized protein LOC123096559 isoform X1 [Triticum aestivum]